MASCINIGAAQVKDHGPACDLCHQWPVAKLPRPSLVAWHGWPVQHGLAMKADGGNIGKGGAVAFGECFNSFCLGDGQVALGLGEDSRFRPLEIPSSGRLQTFLQPCRHRGVIWHQPVRAEFADAPAIGAKKGDVDPAVENRSRHQSGEPARCHHASPFGGSVLRVDWSQSH